MIQNIISFSLVIWMISGIFLLSFSTVEYISGNKKLSPTLNKLANINLYSLIICLIAYLINKL